VRARDDQNGDRPNDGFLRPADDAPHHRGDDGGAQREPEQPARGGVSQPLRPRCRVLRLGDQPLNSRERGVVTDGGDPDAQPGIRCDRARDDVITNNKDLVKKFVGAMMKGLQYTLDHPDEAAAILNKAQPAAKIPAAIGEINAMKPYTSPPNGAPLGYLDQQRVARTIAILQGNGLMPAGMTPDKVADFSFVTSS